MAPFLSPHENNWKKPSECFLKVPTQPGGFGVLLASGRGHQKKRALGECSLAGQNLGKIILTEREKWG